MSGDGPQTALSSQHMLRKGTVTFLPQLHRLLLETVCNRRNDIPGERAAPFPQEPQEEEEPFPAWVSTSPTPGPGQGTRPSRGGQPQSSGGVALLPHVR